MITDEELQASVSEMERLAGIQDVELPPVDVGRVDRIVERAMYQAVVKDSISFVFHSFTTALAGMGAGLLGIRTHRGGNHSEPTSS